MAEIGAEYRDTFGLRLEEVTLSGEVRDAPGPGNIRNNPFMRRVRMQSLNEAVRWGEACTFFLAPGIISWIVPVMDGPTVLGGLLGGEVFPAGIESDRNTAIFHLTQTGCSSSDILQYINELADYPRERIKEAGEFIRTALMKANASAFSILDRNRDDAIQQREIAQFIQEKKQARSSRYSLDQERILLSLIRVGDKNGARGVLNDMLASSFLYSPRLPIMKARMIEVMGHLVRSAIEDSPVLERLLDRQQLWINAIIEARQFNDLCKVVRRSMDDFIDRIFLQGYNRTNEHVRRALVYIAKNYRGKITLDEVAERVGLSKYRISHLMKEVTGQTIFQHVKRMRVDKAQELLATTEQSYSEITYELGFTDQSAFIKQFRELTGTTPARFRKGR